jgi:hypothetical protein
MYFPTFRVIAAITAFGFFPSLAARADVITDWNAIALQAIRTDKTPPPKASRALAMLHVAIYDTVGATTKTHDPYLVSWRAPRVVSVNAAVAAAARAVLAHLYPVQSATFDTAYTNAIAALPGSTGRQAGITWGEYVAKRVLAHRANDGATAVVTYTPGADPGDWQPTPPALAAALLPQWPNVRPFVMTSGHQFRPPPPPQLNTALYAFDFNLVKDLGSSISTTRTAEQTAVATFWADGSGTVTPPGHWNVIARDVATAQGNTVAQNARLFALLNVALADAAICAWDCKYADNLWRPITAIRAADTDGNSATSADPTWTPLLATPPFPEYVSGHSTFSGAAATVLASFFGADDIAFTTTSEDLPGVARSFNSFWEAAAEAGLSRVFGGIHFMSGNQQGLQSGARLGAFVTEHAFGECVGRPPRPAKQ